MAARKEAVCYQAVAEAMAKEWSSIDPSKDQRRWDVERGRWMVRDTTSSGCWLADPRCTSEYWVHKRMEEEHPGDAQLARQVISVLKCHPDIAVCSDYWDQSDAHLGTPAGVIDLDDQQVVSQLHDYFVTMRTGTKASTAPDCPRWVAFLTECVAGDLEVVGYLQRWCGYCLSGYTSEHACLFVHGSGGNGKSKFVEVLEAVWGEYARTLPMDALMDRDNDRHTADIAMLVGARLAIASETQEGRRWDEAKLKTLTGGDRISARFMRQDWFVFKPRFKLMIVGNHAPQIGSVDDALRRRLHLLPFTNKPANPDPDLFDKLWAERRGIMRWCLDGFRAWRERGLDAPEAVLAATRDYFDEQDTMGQFLQECTVAEPGAEVSSSSLCQAYAEWASKNGVGPKSAKRLSAEMRKRGYQPCRSEKWRGFKGLRLASMAQPTELPY